jgi:hypothetical protein
VLFGFWAVIATRCRSSWSCTHLATTRLGMSGRFVRALLRQLLVQELLKSGPERVPVLAECQRLHPPSPRPAR